MEVREQAESSRRMALIALTSMLVYFAVDNHVPLYPWNYLAQLAHSGHPRWLPGLLTLWAL